MGLFSKSQFLFLPMFLAACLDSGNSESAKSQDSALSSSSSPSSTQLSSTDLSSSLTSSSSIATTGSSSSSSQRNCSVEEAQWLKNPSYTDTTMSASALFYNFANYSTINQLLDSLGSDSSQLHILDSLLANRLLGRDVFNTCLHNVLQVQVRFSAFQCSSDWSYYAAPGVSDQGTDLTQDYFLIADSNRRFQSFAFGLGSQGSNAPSTSEVSAECRFKQWKVTRHAYRSYDDQNPLSTKEKYSTSNDSLFLGDQLVWYSR